MIVTFTDPAHYATFRCTPFPFTYCTLIIDRAIGTYGTLSLDFLQVRLGDVQMEHFDTGCRSKLMFYADTMSNRAVLMTKCETCDTSEVLGHT